MLFIVSDIHLTDGTSGETIKAGAFRTFAESVIRTVSNAASQTGERIAPARQVDILFLGDFFDCIRSDQWQKNGVRPWDNPADEPYLNTVLEIVRLITETNWDSLSYLRQLTQTGITLHLDGETIHVPLRLHYMVGNHDWFFHLPPSPLTNAIRKTAADAVGLSNPVGEPFPHVVDEAYDSLKEVLSAHRVYAQHGDSHDPFNFNKEVGRNASSLGDAIVVELLNGFPLQVKNELQLPDNHGLYMALKEIDNVRPLLDIPNWVNSALQIQLSDEAIRQKVMDVWDDRVDDFLNLDFISNQDRQWRFDAVDKIQLALKFSKSVSLSTLGKIVSLFGDDEEEDYVEHALREKSLRLSNCDFVVYGHTHTPMMAPLDEVPVGDLLVDRLYFNTGTWRQVHKKCASPHSIGYAKFATMHFNVFFLPHERRGRRFETWSGTLG